MAGSSCPSNPGWQALRRTQLRRLWHPWWTTVMLLSLVRADRCDLGLWRRRERPSSTVSASGSSKNSENTPSSCLLVHEFEMAVDARLPDAVPYQLHHVDPLVL
jgi:hypothetical protein